MLLLVHDLTHHLLALAPPLPRTGEDAAGWLDQAQPPPPGPATNDGGQGVITNLPVTPPQGTGTVQKLDGLVSNVKWLALLSCAAAFFVGLIVFTVGRVADHRRGSTVGTLMILASMGAGLLFGIGPGLIASLAGTG